MSRKARITSESGIYHIMIRGVNKQEIFVDEQDKIVFINLLTNAKEKYKFYLFSYVLMDNHVHMEIKEKDISISRIIQSIATSYAIYFNEKYNRIGHLFQNRFKSKPVESNDYLINLLRYIHQNPEKAGIQSTENYKWSSYFDYINVRKKLVDIDYIYDLIDKDRNKAILKFKEMHQKIMQLNSSEKILEYEIKNSLDYEEIIICIDKKIGIDKMKEIKRYNKREMIKEISKLSDIKGVNTCQIAKILKVDVRIVREAFKSVSPKEQKM